MKPMPKVLSYSAIAASAVLLAQWQPPGLDASQARAASEPALQWLGWHDNDDGRGSAASGLNGQISGHISGNGRLNASGADRSAQRHDALRTRQP